MRLLNSRTLKLAEFFGHSIPPYAILSHTWGDDEVSFQDMQGSDAEKKEGYKKIKGCCEMAVVDGFEYAWVDTCCIDKSSSSELSEAINSMWEWYRVADVCYVYLSDVDGGIFPWYNAFRESRWFTRGWTLQELIAPTNLIFYASDWQELGTKSSLKVAIASITGVHIDVLSGGDLESLSVAQRMSWASNRETTRVEDMAYCLMGIFKVNFPMLYGEGRRAFVRLQEEIMKNSDDHTIFAWKSKDRYERHGGILASSPASFKDSDSIVQLRFKKSRNFLSSDIRPFSVTNRGIFMELPMKLAQGELYPRYAAVLDCYDTRKKDHAIGLWLRKHGDAMTATENYLRDKSEDLLPIEISHAVSYKIASLYVKGWGVVPRPTVPSSTSISIPKILEAHGITVRKIWPVDRIGSYGRIRFADKEPWGWTFFQFTGSSFRDFIVILKTNLGKVSANIVKADESENLEDLANRYSKPPQADWVEQPDRIAWQLGGGKQIVLAIRRQIFEGRRTQVVTFDVNSHQSDDSSV